MNLLIIKLNEMKRKNYLRPDWAVIPAGFKYFAVHNEGMYLFETKPKMMSLRVGDEVEKTLLGEDKERGTYIGQLRGAEDGVFNRPANSRTVAAVIGQIQEREKRGLAKYGMTMDRQDLGYRQWQQHLLEELMDAVLYLRRVMNFEIYSEKEHRLYMSLYNALPKKFTRSEAGAIGNEMCLDSDVVNRLLKNEGLFEFANNHYYKRPL